MKIIISAFILLQSFGFSQVSLSDLNKLTSSQLNELREELSIENPTSMKNALESEDSVNQESSEIKIKQKNSENLSSLFGYDYFNKQINFFDNIPTPVDFKLGAGDEIILSLWGEKNSREKFILNKDGMIYYQNIGFINLSGKTLNEAENLLSSELSRIYSTLSSSNNSTQLMLELGKIKSVNVYFSGQVTSPGINLIHPFSDIFSALIQAGGVKDSGSLRKVQIIRNSEIVAVVDFYSFFLNGMNSFSNIRLLDGDVIHVPVIANRAEIKGEIINPGIYELLDSDLLSNLINYAGGLSSMASNKAVINDIIPIDKRDSDDSARSGRLIYLSQTDKIKIQNGSVVELIPIAKNDTFVSVFGRVVRPGKYPLDLTSNQNEESGITLKEILDVAGGFDDPIFRKTINNEILILRLDENQFYGKEFKVNYKDAHTFKLKINDNIFVYEKPEYKNSFTFTIRGEVNSPGTYPLKDGLSLSEAIILAGGITEIGSISSVSVSKNLISIDEDGNQKNRVEMVSNVGLGFKIADKNIITILPKTNVVRVYGNVYNPGFIAHQSGNDMTMSRAIELAGGYKPNSLKKRAYVVRANGEIDKANIFRGRTKRVFPGDSIFVPVNPDQEKFDITTFIADLSSTLANIAAILVIADNN